MSRGVTKKAGAGRIIAIAGCKGGVGKSLIATNLAVALGHAGQRVVIVDGDLGAPNLHTLFGINSPGRGLQAFFDHEIESLAEADMASVAYNVSLIAGAAGSGIANINHGQKQRLVNHIRALDTDVVVLDLGAGTAFNMIDLFTLADVRLLVMAPQLTSMQNAYTFLKGAVHRMVQHVADDREQRERTAGSAIHLGDVPIRRILDAIRLHEPEVALRAQAQLRHFGLGLVGNLIYQDKDAQALLAMSRMIRDYLTISAPVVAAIRYSVPMRDAANARRPLLLDGMGGPVGIEILRLVRAVLEVDVGARRAARAAAQPNAPGLPPAEGKDDGKGDHRATRH